jgi:hypothetical protein
MLAELERASKNDKRLAELLVNAGEFAEIYRMARKRQKGCDGMGELAMVKEEFRDSVDKMIQYGKERNYIDETVSYEIDSLADELSRL